MTTIQRHPKLDVLVEHDVVTHSTARRALAVLRVAFGLTFLWAFFDKLFALGFHTGVNAETGVVDRFGDAAWINGGSPTTGFLKFGVPEDNPFQGFFNGMAGSAWADWLFMAGLLGIGLALTLGIGMRIAAAAGALLYALMWAACCRWRTTRSSTTTSSAPSASSSWHSSSQATPGASASGGPAPGSSGGTRSCGRPDSARGQANAWPRVLVCSESTTAG